VLNALRWGDDYALSRTKVLKKYTDNFKVLTGHDIVSGLE
jgi:hypothetical protein